MFITPDMIRQMTENKKMTGEDLTNYLREGMGLAYETARYPLTASENIARIVKEMASQPGISRSQTAQPIFKEATIRQAPPGMGVQSPLAKGAQLATETMGMIPGTMAETAIAKSVPLMAGITRSEFVKGLAPALKGFVRRSRVAGEAPEFISEGVKQYKRLVKQYPEGALETLGPVAVKKGATEVTANTAARYMPKTVAETGTAYLEFPEFLKKLGSISHEGGHHILETIADNIAKDPGKYTGSFRQLVLQALGSDRAIRNAWWKEFDMVNLNLLSLYGKRWLTREEVSEFQTRMLNSYQRAIPHETFANTYQRAIKEGVPERADVRKALQALVATRDKSKALASKFPDIRKKTLQDVLDRVQGKKTALEASIEGQQMIDFWKQKTRPSKRIKVRDIKTDLRDIIRGSVGGGK